MLESRVGPLRRAALARNIRHSNSIEGIDVSRRLELPSCPRRYALSRVVFPDESQQRRLQAGSSALRAFGMTKEKRIAGLNVRLIAGDNSGAESRSHPSKM